MPYATVVDVETFNALRTFSNTSRPSVDDVVRFLHETGAVLDGILSALGYTLPVPSSATGARELLEHYNAIGAWAYTEAAAPESDQRALAEQAWARAQKMLRDGLIEPPGLSKDTTTAAPRMGFTPTALFTRDMSL